MGPYKNDYANPARLCEFAQKEAQKWKAVNIGNGARETMRGNSRRVQFGAIEKTS